MIRHPWLRTVQAACALAVSLWTAFALQAAPPPSCLSLLLVGERETASGAWEGADLLLRPDAPVQRFQLALSPGREAFVELFAQADGLPAQRLYPAAGQSGALRAGGHYALPGPGDFYLLSGTARLRLVVRPPGADGAPAHAAPTPFRDAQPEPLRLTDGTRFVAAPERVCGAGALSVQWALHD